VDELMGRLMAGTQRVSGPWKSGLFAGLQGTPEEQLLSATALGSVSALAGQLPPSALPLAQDTAEDPTPLAREETLAEMLGGEHRELLPEWLGLCKTRGRRVPPFYLPALLTVGVRDRTLRPAIAAVAGKRALWLARRNPEWKFLLSQDEDLEIWETGSGTVRAEWLAGLRRREPERARELLQQTWATESADDRARMLESFEHGLSARDQDFVEAAATDRSKLVRRVAARLLIYLPGTTAQRQWIERVRSWVQLRRESRWMGLSKSTKLEVHLPAERPEDPEQLLSADNTMMGEKAWWLGHAVALSPLWIWEGSPEEWIDAARASDWQLPMQWGWGVATVRERNVLWARALLERQSSGEELWMLLPHAEREQMLLQRMGDLPPKWLAWHKPYSEAAAQRLYEFLLQRTRVRWEPNVSRNLAQVLPDLALVVPPKVPLMTWPDDTSAWSYWSPRVEQFLSRLHFRQRMHEEMK
jgi:hypothetical protein